MDDLGRVPKVKGTAGVRFSKEEHVWLSKK